MEIKITKRYEDGTGTRHTTKVYADTDYVRKKFVELNNAYSELTRPLKYIDVSDNNRDYNYVEINITAPHASKDDILIELFKRIVENKVTHVTIANSSMIFRDKECHMFIKCERLVLEVIKDFDEIDNWVGHYGTKHYSQLKANIFI